MDCKSTTTTFSLIFTFILVLTYYHFHQEVQELTVSKYAISGYKFISYAGWTNDINDDFAQQKRYFDKLSKSRRKSISGTKRLASLQMYIVPQISCPTAVRVGRIGDGGKWVCNPWRVKSPCVIYSFGVNGDTSFESNIYELTLNGCKIYSFDMGPQKENLFTSFQGVFKQWKISAQTNESNSEWSVVDIAKYFSNDKIDFVKMDIEKSEFRALPVLLNSSLVTEGKVCQIFLELHTNVKAWKSLQTLLEQRGFLMFYKEANMYCLECYEYSYIHESCLKDYGLANNVFNKNYI